MKILLGIAAGLLALVGVILVYAYRVVNSIHAKARIEYLIQAWPKDKPIPEWIIVTRSCADFSAQGYEIKKDCLRALSDIIVTGFSQEVSTRTIMGIYRYGKPLTQRQTSVLLLMAQNLAKQFAAEPSIDLNNRA